jgi:F-type H+-transporting ATPase subunit epsilon
MNNDTFKIELVTPEGLILSAYAWKVEFTSSQGELGILPGHVPLLTTLAPGHLRTFIGNSVREFAIAEGYVQVRPSFVRIVAALAIDSVEIDQIEHACAKAKEALKIAAAENPEVIQAEIIQLRHEFMELSRKRHLRN